MFAVHAVDDGGVLGRLICDEDARGECETSGSKAGGGLQACSGLEPNDPDGGGDKMGPSASPVMSLSFLVPPTCGGDGGRN